MSNTTTMIAITAELSVGFEYLDMSFGPELSPSKMTSSYVERRLAFTYMRWAGKGQGFQ